MLTKLLTVSITKIYEKSLVSKDNFVSFAIRSYISTGIAQFLDNLVFAVMVSYVFFGWTPLQVITCSLTGALAELLFEIVLSPIGYRVTKGWKAEKVGEEYIRSIS